VKKVSSEPVMKQWMCGGRREWRAGERWICERDISRVFCTRLAEWDRKLIPEMRWCIAKWATGDFYRSTCRWLTEGDNTDNR